MMMRGPSRRAFLATAAAAGVAGPTMAQGGDAPGAPLAPWRPGWIDIHHIATGRGDCALVVGPRGDSLMIDAGASGNWSADAMAVSPGPERRAGEWIGRYARRALAPTGRMRIDTLLVTHLHPDHLGDIGEDTPLAADGTHRLTGVGDVAAALPVGLIVDRGFPDYARPEASKAPMMAAPFLANYRAFIASRRRAGGRVERFRVGANDQMALPGATVRNLAAGGEVWTGQGEGARALFPDPLPDGRIPDENAWSAAIRLDMGDFRYFAAGDLTSNSYDGALPWRDIETPAARAAGPVSVAVAAHHGMFDATGADVVRALRPRAWIIQGWHAAHPSMDAVERMMSPYLYAGPRDIFATGVTAANLQVNRRLVERFASAAGHVVVRVEPGGGRFRVVVTDNTDEADRVKAVFGPFHSAVK